MPLPQLATGGGGEGTVRGVVLDFDGTVTLDDIGDLVCGHFAPPAWRDIDARWIRGELSLMQAQERMWSLCRCTRAQAVAYALEVGRVRPGLDLLLQAARSAGSTVWLASGGFDFYIEPILGPLRLPLLAERFYNSAHFDGTTVQVRFPHPTLACERCAICKGQVCLRARSAMAGPIAFVGDGHSDRCVLDHGHADLLFPVRGSVLERLSVEQGVPASPFSDLSEVAQALFPAAIRESPDPVPCE